MNIAQIEVLIHRVSGLLLPPVSLATTLLFFYAFLRLSGILSQYLQRRRNNRYYFQTVRFLTGEGPALRLRPVRGYPLFSHYQENPHKAAEDLEIFALITVAITLWAANVKQHWLVGELNDLKTCLTRQEK